MYYYPAGLTVSLVLIAVGAILVWAVTGEVEGLDIDVVGVILIIVGIVGALISLLSWGGVWGPGYRRRTYVEGEPPARYYRRPRRAVIEEEEEVGPPGPPGPPPP